MLKSLSLSDRQERSLKRMACALREDVVRMLANAGSGHPAGSLGMADVITALYFHVLVHRPKQPNWKDRDRVFLSNGHIVPVLYAALARAGYFSPSLLKTLRVFGSRLQGHPEYGTLPGIEHTSGPLGSASSQAIGAAYAARMDQAPWRVYCLMSDGELQEGQTWEAMLFASKYRLSNCTFILDRNHIQIDGNTEDVMPLEPLQDKFASFGLSVIHCDGHDIRQIVHALSHVQHTTEKPTMIIADTIPGRGVDFMEGDFHWHGKVPRPGSETTKAIKQLHSFCKEN
jgi:transketolase